MGNEWLTELKGLPRDGLLVTHLPGVAALAESYGRRVLLQGRDFAEHRDLRDRWSQLSRRVGIAHIIGPQALTDSVTHFCNVTHINRNTSIRRSRRWAEHLVRNLLLLSEKPHGMRQGAFAGMPAYIVGAGPSLDKNREELWHRSGVVICVNSASRAICGHAVFSVESNDLSEKLDRRNVQLLSLTSPPHVLRERYEYLRPVWTGEIAWVPELLTGVPRLPTSGGGTTAAASLAYRWGCDPIVLVGQDLAWTDGRVYAEATGFNDRISDDGTFAWQESGKLPRPENPLPDKDDVMRVRAWGGQGTVLCSVTHQSMRMWLGAAADTYAVRCINATEGGSHIPGWEDVRLKDLPVGYGPNVVPDKYEPWAKDVASECAGELLPRDNVIDWLRTEAPNALAETWAYRAISDRIDEHRKSEPLRVPLLEALHVQRVRRDVEDIVDQARAEIRRVVEEVCQI